MGRRYFGDIKGKFAFAIQQSDDASFFGGNVCEPNEIYYYFDTNDLKTLEQGLETCKKELGDYKQKIDDYFKSNGTYSDEKLAKELETTEEKVRHLLTWYYRLELGTKIYDKVKETGECNFTAEC